ncbi:MAG: TonB-dependent receptor [Cyclobacteriaceae bacterium]|nr:TonB-dependent receptor [Cyclobacteriaceae bacterium]MCH8516834.1 TonB-dependent receptor [Cyclobacteriaceae bacterium]
MKCYFFALCFLIAGSINAQEQRFERTNFQLSGYVKDAKTGELLLGVNLYLPETEKGTSTNRYGFYSINIPSKAKYLRVSAVGFRTEIIDLDAIEPKDHFDIELLPEFLIDEVVIEAERELSMNETPQMSKISLSPEVIKNMPMLFGERDVMKTIQLLPGVQGGNEGFAGIYVRGGGADQNLILLDDAIVYNANHLFGFFSVFNGDAIKGVELYKGGFPARFGGRASSVIDLSMKDGNKKEFGGEAGIGLISSRLMLEGPIIKDKSSFIISGRRTYLDVLARPFMTEDISAGYFFYDLNAKANYEINDNHKLYASGYFGRDKFYARDNFNDNRFESGLDWGNATATLRWNHKWNSKLFTNTSLIFSDYQFGIFAEEEWQDESFFLNYSSGIRDFSLKYDVDYIPHIDHHLRFGAQVIHHQFTPTALVARDSFMEEDINNTVAIGAVESAIYIEDHWSPSVRWDINAGLRLSQFSVRDKSYVNPEPRLSVAYHLRPDLSLKASFADMYQYLHLLSSTGIGLPTDLWVPATDQLVPQSSRQVALGIHKTIRKGLEFSIEGYYKTGSNILQYKEGASFLDIDLEPGAPARDRASYEDQVTAGEAEAMGIELLLQKSQGKFHGWIGYTWSTVNFHFPELNSGRSFNPRHDRPHDISIVGIYDMSSKITFSATWQYGTGAPITMPRGREPRMSFGSYRNQSTQIGTGTQTNSWLDHSTDFGDRNDFRMESFHSLNLSVQFHKKTKWGKRTWDVGVYNAYNRQNPFFYYIREDWRTQEQKMYRVTLFPIIPSITYNATF